MKRLITTCLVVTIILLFLISTVQAVDGTYHINNQSGQTLYHQSIEVQLCKEQLGTSQPQFENVRFMDDISQGNLLCSWLAEVNGNQSATFWVRVPVLLPGLNTISFAYDETGGSKEPATSLVPQLLAKDGIRLALQTDPPDKETTHPSVVIAEGWMTRLRPDSEPNVNRVLVDTMWPSDPSPYPIPDALENPEVWLSQDGGLTWSWPPDVNVNPAWPYHNNWLVGQHMPGANNSDPEAIFLCAHSLPNGTPATDTLRVYHRDGAFGTQKIVFIDVTSTNNAWSGVNISAFNPTNITGQISDNLSPAVIQESDGSLLMWLGFKAVDNTITMKLYRSVDGCNFNLVGNVTIDRPVALQIMGPWHFDVIKEGGVYWMAASFCFVSQFACELRMLRSEDGLNFELLFPTVLEKGLSDNWFYPGTYRPTMLYLPGEGLEMYVGSNARLIGIPAIRGGTGRWVDTNWAPDVARPVEDIAMVFWGSARDFIDAPSSWPHPWYPINNSLNTTTMTYGDSAVTLTAQSSQIPRAEIDSAFYRPQNHEFHIKMKIANECYADLQGNGYYGPWIDSRSKGGRPSGVTYRWGATSPVCGPLPIGNINDFHILESRRVGNQGWLWWDNTQVPVSPFSLYGQENVDDLVWQVCRSTGNSLSIDWYFYRDAIEPEPIIGFLISGNIGIDGVTLNGLPGNPVTSSDGSYSTVVPYGWSGTVIPTKDGYNFTPASKEYTNIIADQNNQNYTAAIITLTISGTTGINGVIMDGLPGNPVTSDGGFYSAVVPYGWSGIVTPTLTGYSFSPESVSYTNITSDLPNRNFTATLIPTYTISGTTGVRGVVMNGLPGNPVTGNGGCYSAIVPYGWSGTVTPIKTGYDFSPESVSYTNVTSDLPNRNFTAISTMQCSISGTTGVDGVIMNGLPGNPVTSGGGFYIANVPYGWDGTITPSKTGYSFSPESISYTDVTSNLYGRNFIATPLVTFIISGTTGVDGVIMNGLPGNPVTSGGGLYIAVVPDGWNGTVTPSKTGYIFSPESISYTNVSSDLSERNFTATQIITFTISGTTGVDGVTMTGLPGNPVTSGGGLYSAIVLEGWSGTVMPTKKNYIFSPSSMPYSNVIADINDQDYTGHNIYDFNGDGVVGYSDLMEFCEHWLETGTFNPYDFNEDGTVNFADFADFASAW